MTSTADSVLDEVLSERLRQVNRHGYTAAHDDEHDRGEITRAALNYVGAASLCAALDAKAYSADTSSPLDNMGHALAWPWDIVSWKPGLVRRMLIKAMALCCAEVERIDRLEAKKACALSRQIDDALLNGDTEQP